MWQEQVAQLFSDVVEQKLNEYRNETSDYVTTELGPKINETYEIASFKTGGKVHLYLDLSNVSAGDEFHILIYCRMHGGTKYLLADRMVVSGINGASEECLFFHEFITPNGCRVMLKYERGLGVKTITAEAIKVLI